MYDHSLPPEDLVAFARHAERGGVDDVWVVEDFGWADAVTSAAAVLASTERIRVGIGATPAPLRNPALLAMELATLARMYPGRLAAGVSHGVPEWMAQAGATVGSPLTLLEETISAVRSLLRGDRVTTSGRYVNLDGVRLVHPPNIPPPVLAAVFRPRSLRLSGRIADGTILIEGRGPNDVSQAIGIIEDGRTESTIGSAHHEFVAFVLAHVSDDEDSMGPLLGPVVAEYSEFLEVDKQDVYAATGPAKEVGARLEALWESGVDTVVLHLLGDDHRDQLDRALASCARR